MGFSLAAVSIFLSVDSSLTIAIALRITAARESGDIRSLQPQAIPCYKLVHHGPMPAICSAASLRSATLSGGTHLQMNNDPGGANYRPDQTIAAAPQFSRQTAQGGTANFYEKRAIRIG
jgi:hypothetical protein